MASLAFAAALLAAPAGRAEEPPCEADEDCDDGACRDGRCTTKLPPPVPRREEAPASGTSYETRDYLPLAIAGACVFGSAWISTIALVAGAVSQEEPIVRDDGSTQKKDLDRAVGLSFVPVAGPILLRSEGVAPADDRIDAVLVVLSSLQAMGLMATVLGLTVESHLERPAAAVIPSVTPNGAGVVAVGRF